jgi:hypothetical protein
LILGHLTRPNLQHEGSDEDCKRGSTVELVQTVANHESTKMNKLYDRTVDPIDLDEIMGITICEAALTVSDRPTSKTMTRRGSPATA